MTLKELAILLARAPMLEPEREAWSALVPYLSKADLVRLGEVLEHDIERMDALKKSFEAEYSVIKKTEELREAKSGLF
jgi:hypothetical protein